MSSVAPDTIFTFAPITVGVGESYKDESTLRRLYRREHMDTTEIAERFDVSPGTVRYHMDKNGIERDPMGPKITPPGMFLSPQGYEVFEPDDGDGRLRHHRLLAVAEYGFDAVAGNDVHHKNGVPWANWPSNLEVIGHDDHAAEHAAENEFWKHRENVRV